MGCEWLAEHRRRVLRDEPDVHSECAEAVKGLGRGKGQGTRGQVPREEGAVFSGTDVFELSAPTLNEAARALTLPALNPQP